MPKINQTEYKTLKSLADEGYDCLKRNETEGLYVYKVKYDKMIVGAPAYVWSIDDGTGHDLFDFIKSKDAEPYNIQELIEEYEHDKYWEILRNNPTIANLVKNPKESTVHALPENEME